MKVSAESALHSVDYLTIVKGKEARKIQLCIQKENILQTAQNILPKVESIQLMEIPPKMLLNKLKVLQ